MSGRIRTVKPEWLEDELLALASDAARVLSVALMLLADDFGNGRANLVILAGQAFPGKPPEHLAKAIEELEKIHFVTLYGVDGQSYFSIRSWSKHQKVDHPSKPRVPPPSKNPRETIRKPREKIANTRASRGYEVVVPVQVVGTDPIAGAGEPTEATGARAEARAVFEAWKLDTGHVRAELDRKREARLVARLRDGFTPEQLIQVTKNWRNDPWLTGETSGRVYDGIETLFRDRAQVERLIDLIAPMASGPKLRKAHAPMQGNHGLTGFEGTHRTGFEGTPR